MAPPSAKPLTRRGRRGGKRHPRRITHQSYEHTSKNYIPQIVTVNRVKHVHTNSKPPRLVYPYIHREPLFDIRLWNARSIRKRSLTLNSYVTQYNIDVFFVVETWLAVDDPVVIGELRPDGYTYLSFPRGTDNHGGIGVLFKSPLGFRLHPLNIQSTTFEYASILDPNNGIHYIIVYRPTPSPDNGYTTAGFLDEFESFLPEISALPGKLVILGDFKSLTFITMSPMFGLQIGLLI